MSCPPSVTHPMTVFIVAWSGIAASSLPSSFRVQVLPTPAAAPSCAPRLGGDQRLGIHVSWIEKKKSADGLELAELRFARLHGDEWTAPQRIAGGDRWIVNWADFPAVAALDETNLVAHFLERSGKDTYDYHVRVVRSADAGKTWNASTRLHSDAGPGEHGFVSWTSLGERGLAAVWLDGRNTKSQTASPGPMALYTRVVAKDGTMGGELLLDDRVCDCCQTAAVRAPDGALLVAYRDRSEDEVRDISVVRLTAGGAPDRVWSSRDGWKIAGCPVNGPVLAVAADRVALVWFTMGSDGNGRVLCARSPDMGKSFSAPTKLAGDDALGRVDAVFDSSGQLVVTWLETVESRARWRVARVDSSGRLIDVETAADASSGRDSGLARLAADTHGVVFAYTESGAEPRVATRRLIWDTEQSR